MTNPTLDAVLKGMATAYAERLFNRKNHYDGAFAMLVAGQKDHMRAALSSEPLASILQGAVEVTQGFIFLSKGNDQEFARDTLAAL